jgi:hypothetical protein
MEKLIINKGYKEYAINDDENAVIRVKTTDFGLMDRLYHFKDKIKAVAKKLEAKKKSENAEDILAALRTADEDTRRELDDIFDEKVSDAVFGRMNCMSFAGGQPVALNFLNAIIPKIEKDLEAEHKAANKKISKYTDAAKRFK